ncbi:hypothetical protein [Parablautia muri]|uniref:Uncharacterized protein n=1 Tax=Parablautia muri TaxID=2320879 RepID=A0A9X5GRG4_9FIRM|nr:hypothetical protein [Parablautia muri]NBJ93203.1 hypothetical protein [Parablautia muri]
MENINVVAAQDEAEKEVQQIEERVKPYTFRKLNSTDLFPMIKLITKIGIDELTEVFEGDTIKKIIDGVTKKEKNITGEESDVEKEATANGEKNAKGKEIIVGIGVALKLVNKIMEHIPSCENDIYTLLSRVSGMSIEEIKGLDLDVFMKMLLDFVTKEEFWDFFKVASEYIKRLG